MVLSFVCVFKRVAFVDKQADSCFFFVPIISKTAYIFKLHLGLNNAS